MQESAPIVRTVRSLLGTTDRSRKKCERIAERARNEAHAAHVASDVP
jgi:hypothetical protein